MLITDISTGDRVMLEGVSWRQYLQFDRVITDRRLRSTYDRGRLELVSPSPFHEMRKEAIGQMVEILVEDFDLPSADLGSTTFRHSGLKWGLEPDSCYYIENSGHIRGKRTILPGVDPPPDLAIEADVTSSSLRRLRIYAAFGVPEVWRFDGEKVVFLRLTRARKYASRSRSVQFPGFRAADATRFALGAVDADKTAWRKAFRAWVRDRLLPR
jgi:Uma2 family endonuclease